MSKQTSKQAGIAEQASELEYVNVPLHGGLVEPKVGTPFDLPFTPIFKLFSAMVQLVHWSITLQQ